MTHSELSKYGHIFKLELIYLLLHDKTLLFEVREVLRLSHFDGDHQKWVIEKILWYYDKYHMSFANGKKVLSGEWLKIRDDSLKAEVKLFLAEVYAVEVQSPQYIKDEAINFFRTREMADAVLDSVKYINMGQSDIMMEKIAAAYKATTTTYLGHDYKRDIEARFTEDVRDTVATPWGAINDLLKGGLACGELGILFGNPGSGKSWMMTAIAAEALKAGKKVCYYALEMTEIEVSRRFDSYFLGVDSQLVIQRKDDLVSYISGLLGNLIVKEYSPNSASINTIKNHYLRCADGSYGRPDLIVIDYVDYLRPVTRRYDDRKSELDSLYIGAKGLASELKVPVWTPAQINRSGAKNKVLHADKIAGSYDKVMIADFCMSLSRTPEDKAGNTGRLHIMKNRAGKDAKTFDLTCDLSCGKIELGGESVVVDNEEFDVPF